MLGLPSHGGPGSAAFMWVETYHERLAAAESEAEEGAAFFNDDAEAEKYFVGQARCQGFVVTTGEQWREVYREHNDVWRPSAKRLAEYSAEIDRIKRSKELTSLEHQERRATLERNREACERKQLEDCRRENEREKRERRLIKMKLPLLRVLEKELVGSQSVRDCGESCVGTRVVYEPKSNLFWLFYRAMDTEITGFGLAPVLISDEGRTVLSKRIIRAAQERLNA